jgi:prephenate dehydratase
MSRQPQLKISIQGYQGSFHHIVSQQVFGAEITLLERSTFAEVFADAESGSADFSVAAIENSIAGSIYETYDLLLKSELQIVGERYLQIHQNLIGLPGAELRGITTVYSHPMAIRQCQDVLEKHPHIKIVTTDDTAGSVRQIMKIGDTTQAAISSSLSAEVYGAEILQKNIETDHQNFTRFVIVSKKDIFPALGSSVAMKTSLALHLKHQPGALARVIQIFADHNLNLTKIESRPIIGQAWEYSFYLDFTHPNNPDEIKKILNQLGNHTSFLKILGTYPEGETLYE